MRIRIDCNGLIHCPGCDALMKKLYWRRVIYEGAVETGFGHTFTEWYGCTDCGKYIYDKHESVVLSHFKENSE